MIANGPGRYAEARRPVRTYHGINSPVEGRTAQPSEDQMMAWIVSGVCEATDGCFMEPDGYCEHRYPSWFLYLGFI